MKRNIFMSVCFVFFEKPLKDFPSIHLFFLLFGLDAYKYV